MSAEEPYIKKDKMTIKISKRNKIINKMHKNDSKIHEVHGKYRILIRTPSVGEDIHRQKAFLIFQTCSRACLKNILSCSF